MVCKRSDIHAPVFKPRFIFDNTANRNMAKGWTMVITMSRPWCCMPFFAAFERILFDRSRCHLLVYNNTNDPTLDKILIERCRRYQQWHKQKHGQRLLHRPFASVRMFKSFRPYGGIVFGQHVSWEASKLPTIYNMHKDIVSMITTPYLFLIEDDTLVPPWGVNRLFKILKRNSKRGIASGVEPTRTPRLTDKVRLGAYTLLRPGSRILERISLDPKTRGVRAVDATGFYCLAARTEAWKKGSEILNSELEIQKTAEPNWAIDTLWTNDVKRAGYLVLADFETPCLHMQVIGDRIYNWAVDRAVKKLDYYIEKYNSYATGVDI